jgi:hypothetical protein
MSGFGNSLRQSIKSSSNMKLKFLGIGPQHALALMLAGLALAVAPSRARAVTTPSEPQGPFLKEVTLIGGVAQTFGDGLQRGTAPLAGFIYYRAFTPPQAGKFVLRMLADTVVTELTPNRTPLAQLEEDRFTRAILVRFGFSGCYVPSALWLLCMDDGPRVAWLNQGTTNAQVLGSFPLGLSVHSGHAHPMSLHLRAEFGWWKSSVKGFAQQSNLNLFWLGAGYHW